MSDETTRSTGSPYLTQPEACVWLKVKKSTLEKWRIEGTGPVYREHGGIIVYHIDDLTAWSEEQRRTKTRGLRRKKDDGGEETRG